MKVRYELFPEAYKGNGKFTNKEGSVGEMIYDMGMLMLSDYDKVIPPMEELNKLLFKGSFPRAGEWEPFVVNISEYEDACDYLCSMKLPRPFRMCN